MAAIAQVQVLNKILDTKDFSLVILNNLTEDYFFLVKAEFNYIKHHYETYNTVPDSETFINVFKDFDRFTVTEPDSYLLERLSEDYQHQHMATAFNSVAKLLNEGKVDEASAAFKKAFENMKVSAALNSVDILKDTSRYETYVERTKDFNKYYVTTGFAELDNIIGGWDRLEDYVIFAARPGVGKSLCGLVAAIAAAKAGLRVGMYSGEMSTNKVGYRADSLIGHLSSGYLNHGNISIQSEYERYMAALPSMFTGTLKVITPKDIGGPATVGILRAFIEKEHLDLLVVDQVSLVKDQNHGKTDREAMANISRDLKLLQVAKQIPIIAVSQLNRTKNEDANDDSISTSMISTSDRLDQDATIVIGISKDKKDPNIMTLQIVKNRDGRVGDRLSYYWDFSRGECHYIPGKQENTDTSLQDRYKVPAQAPDKVF